MMVATSSIYCTIKWQVVADVLGLIWLALMLLLISSEFFFIHGIFASAALAVALCVCHLPVKQYLLKHP